MHGYHRHLSLDMEVNLCKLQEASPPIARMISQIRTRYKAPATGSLTRYAFLLDTTKITSVMVSVAIVFSLHAFFVFWPVFSQSILYIRSILGSTRFAQKAAQSPSMGGLEVGASSSYLAVE
jgi:hypothetical protein